MDEGITYVVGMGVHWPLSHGSRGGQKLESPPVAMHRNEFVSGPPLRGTVRASLVEIEGSDRQTVAWCAPGRLSGLP